MSIMQQSSKAQDRTLGVWFQNIDQGTIKLPRFQRFEAWDRGRITSFLDTIINNLPVGVALALEVAGPEKFESRYIATSDPKPPGTVTQHLLDGQQRLTAFWRSMHNNYEWETFFVYFPQFEQQKDKSGVETEIRCVSRWFNKHQLRMPRWAEDPAQCLQRGLLPVNLLQPGDISTEIDSWLNDATKPLEPADTDPDALAQYKTYTAMRDKIKAEITKLRERVTHFNLPYLSLPADTSKDVALQVFINMNTNSKPLSLYDIIVAEVESAAGQSLHELVAALDEKYPEISRYNDLNDLVLSTSALLQDKLPNTRGMIDMSKPEMLTNWSKLEQGLQRMAALLASQGVFDAARLPTNAVLAVVAACYALIPENGDFLGSAERLLRRYLWSSFFTDRYENSAPSRAYSDYKGLAQLLKQGDFSEAGAKLVPVLDRSEYPLSTIDELLVAKWPKPAGIKARAIMAVTTYLGAVDFADHKQASFESLQKREYHHIFPDALLIEAEIDSYLALNCALITWKTNRTIGRKDPLEYLEDRVDWAGEDTVRQRLRTHLIDYDDLSAAHYAGISGEELTKRLNTDFMAFKRNRARLVEAAMQKLANGDTPDLASIWSVLEPAESIE